MILFTSLYCLKNLYINIIILIKHTPNLPPLIPPYLPHSFYSSRLVYVLKDFSVRYTSPCFLEYIQKFKRELLRSICTV